MDCLAVELSLSYLPGAPCIFDARSPEEEEGREPFTLPVELRYGLITIKIELPCLLTSRTAFSSFLILAAAASKSFTPTMG